MCSRKFPFFILKAITMKSSLKTLRIALASTALISVFAPNAQAEDFQFSGSVTAVACSLGVYSSTAGGSPNNSVSINPVSLTAINGTSGSAGSTAFYVGVPSGCATGGTNGTFNTGFSALNASTNKKAPNTGDATGVTFDITTGSGTGLKSLEVTATPPANSAAATQQTGLSATGVANRQAFAIRYLKTAGTGVSVTAGTVVSTFVATGFYP